MVGDGHQHDFGHGTCTIFTPEVDGFCYARNANVGLADNERLGLDTILLNDDVLIQTDDLLDTLGFEARLLAETMKLGILAPLVDGGIGNPYQDYNRPDLRKDHGTVVIGGKGQDAIPVCFVAVWINRHLVDEIGFLDERMVNYGFDDNDYCLRARRAGWLTAITTGLHVTHGTGGAKFVRGENWSTSYARAGIRETNEAYFRQKHAFTHA